MSPVKNLDAITMEEKENKYWKAYLVIKVMNMKTSGESCLTVYFGIWYLVTLWFRLKDTCISGVCWSKGCECFLRTKCGPGGEGAGAHAWLEWGPDSIEKGKWWIAGFPGAAEAVSDKLEENVLLLRELQVWSLWEAMKMCLKNELEMLLSWESVIKLSQSSISPLRMSFLFLSWPPFFSPQLWKGVGGRKEAVSQRWRKHGRAQWRRKDYGFLLLPTPLRGLLAGSRPLAMGREQ